MNTIFKVLSALLVLGGVSIARYGNLGDSNNLLLTAIALILLNIWTAIEEKK